MRDRLSAETTDERGTRLQQMSTRQRDRLATEIPRLQQMRDRLSAENPAEREARLQQMTQRDRLAAETPKERETRLRNCLGHRDS